MTTDIEARRTAALGTPADLTSNATKDISAAHAESVRLAELRDDNKALATRLRETHSLCEEHGDVASTSLIEVWIDEAERRTWFLFETGRA
ncbi:MAG TPA: ferritin-like domain-containing protein [Methylocella sp.]|nr:ferritin-like domain-containing protein [Methylocella sp.]